MNKKSGRRQRRCVICRLQRRGFKAGTGRLNYLKDSASKTETETGWVFHPWVCRYQNRQEVKNPPREIAKVAKIATRNPPKSPDGGISPRLLTKSCLASNSVWKIGITSLIRITQSKVRPIENLAFSMISAIFEMLLLWTAWSELSLWYQFSTQNLMPNNFWLRVLAKFRHRAIVAIFGGYFWLFSPKRLVFKFNDIPYQTSHGLGKKMA